MTAQYCTLFLISYYHVLLSGNLNLAHDRSLGTSRYCLPNQVLSILLSNYLVASANGIESSRFQHYYWGATIIYFLFFSFLFFFSCPLARYTLTQA